MCAFADAEHRSILTLSLLACWCPQNIRPDVIRFPSFQAAPNHLLLHPGHTPTLTPLPVICRCVSNAGFMKFQALCVAGLAGAGVRNWFIAAEMGRTVSMHDEHSWWRLVMVIYSSGEGHTQGERSATRSITAGSHRGSWQGLHCTRVTARQQSTMVDLNPNLRTCDLMSCCQYVDGDFGSSLNVSIHLDQKQHKLFV